MNIYILSIVYTFIGANKLHTKVSSPRAEILFPRSYHDEREHNFLNRLIGFFCVLNTATGVREDKVRECWCVGTFGNIYVREVARVIIIRSSIYVFRVLRRLGSFRTTHIISRTNQDRQTPTS
jgi:hypothetical protein